MSIQNTSSQDLPIQEKWLQQATKQKQAALIGHGALVLMVSLFAAFMLTFDMLQGIKIWPLLHIDVEIPGTVRGWRVAHVGGLLNGIMMIAIALAFTRISLSAGKLKFIYLSLVFTGWGNTLFYWFGNFSMNRGLSVSDTPYGAGEIFGALSYIAGASVMVFTLIAIIFVAKCAFDSAR